MCLCKSQIIIYQNVKYKEASQKEKYLMWLWCGSCCTMDAFVRREREKVVFSLIVPGLAGLEQGEVRGTTGPLTLSQLSEVYLTGDLMDKTNKQTKGLLPFVCLL